MGAPNPQIQTNINNYFKANPNATAADVEKALKDNGITGVEYNPSTGKFLYDGNYYQGQKAKKTGMLTGDNEYYDDRTGEFKKGKQTTVKTDAETDASLDAARNEAKPTQEVGWDYELTPQQKADGYTIHRSRSPAVRTRDGTTLTQAQKDAGWSIETKFDPSTGEEGTYVTRAQNFLAPKPPQSDWVWSGIKNNWIPPDFYEDKSSANWSDAIKVTAGLMTAYGIYAMPAAAGGTAGVTAETAGTAGTAGVSGSTAANTVAAGTVVDNVAGGGTYSAGDVYDGGTGTYNAGDVYDGGGTVVTGGGTSNGGTVVTGGGGTTGGGTTLPANWWESPSFLSTLMGLGGGYLNTQAGADAAQAQAEAQVKAAEIAAEAAKLRPMAYDTAFSKFTPKYDDKGNFIGVENTLDPTYQRQMNSLKGFSDVALNQFGQGYQDAAPMRQGAQGMMRQGQTAMDAGEHIFNAAAQYGPDGARASAIANQAVEDSRRVAALGGQYLQTSPQEQAQKYMNDQLAMLSPQRATDLANLQANLQATGRAGLSVGGDAGMMASNPQLQAYYNSLRQQDLGLAAQATQGGMDYAKFGTGLLGTSSDLQSKAYQAQADTLNPYKAAVGTAMDVSKYGAGMMGSGGEMLQNMYKTQNSAFTPYGTVMSGMSTLEGLRQNALDVGVSLGSKETAARAQGGQLLANGMSNAANIVGQQAGQAGSTFGNLLSGAGNAFSQYQQNQQNQNMFNQYLRNTGGIR